MGIVCTKIFEYVLTCDKCNFEEVYHTGDWDNGVRVHSIDSAVKASKFHVTKQGYLCDSCFSKKGVSNDKS